MARDLHYKVYSFRLSAETSEKIRELKKDSDFSYNLLLVGMIEQFKLQKYVKKRKQIESKKRSMSNLSKEAGV